jgi:TPR repeat protein
VEKTMSVAEQFPGYTEYQAQQFVAAFPKLLPVAESGNAEAQCMIGMLYQMGRGVEADNSKAIFWYERSAKQGYSVANNNLAGILAIDGQHEESARLYALSREQGFIHGPAPKE